METLDSDLTLLKKEEAGGMESRARTEKRGARWFAQSVGVKIEHSKEDL